MNTEKFFIYARKSTDDLSRQVRSIDDQIAELREMAKREGFEIIDTLIEKQTAKAPGRPIFNAMLERIEKGEATGILAWHPDRLARNSLDGGRIIYLVDTGKITALKFPTFRFETTAQGKFMLSIMFGQSKYYVDNLSENIRRGQRQKIKNGIWPMVAPIGYLNDRATRTIYPDPERGPLVRKIFELQATGTYTCERLCETLTELGLTNRKGHKLARSHFHRLLRNPIYCGLMEYRGEVHEGQHVPLITKKLFDTVQEVMIRKSKPKTPTLKPFVYRGVFRCGECGCFITTECQKGHHYLRCTKRVKKDCSQPYMKEEEVSKQIAEAIRLVALPADWADWMIAELEADQAKASQEAAKAEAQTTLELRQTDEKVDRLTAAYLEGTITLPEYREMKNKLDCRQAASQREAHGFWREPLKAVRTGHPVHKSLKRGRNSRHRREYLLKTQFLQKGRFEPHPRESDSPIHAPRCVANPCSI